MLPKTKVALIKMPEMDSPRLARSITGAILSLPLRLKITVPYLVVAILLVGLATWVVTQAFVTSLQERFNAQLVDGFQSASTQIFESESKALITERAIARTLGVAEAANAHDAATLNTLIRPLAVNAHAPLVYVLDDSGALIYGLRLTPAANVSKAQVDFTSWAAVRRVLAGESDSLGDKFSGIETGPDGAALYLAGPLLFNGQRSGVVVVGFPLGALLPQMVADSTAQVSIYQPDGMIAFSTFLTQSNIPALPSDLLTRVNTTGLHALETRFWTLDANEYNEAVGPLLVRGQPGGWAIAVALPRSLVTSGAQISPLQLAVAFALAVLAVIALGMLVARIIAIPVFELVNASTRVAQGDLEASVREHAQDELGLLSKQFNHMVQQLRQREFMRDLFGRMVSEEVREALLHGRSPQLGGELKVVSVLFTDIRQFTTFSENHTPQEVMGMLNSYFSIVNKAVHEAGGMINKFGGDSAMAIFGAPLSLTPEETARRALKAALSIRIRMTEANAQRVRAGLEVLHIGIGINTGEVITGNIGAEDRFEYTIIGDAVNVAERMQSLASEFTVSNIFIAEATYATFADREQLLVADFGGVVFKGRTEPVRVYNVIGMSSVSAMPNTRKGSLSRRNEVSRRDAFETAYLFCLGFDPRTIALTKNVPLETVKLWITEAASRIERSKRELALEFHLTEAELQRLDHVNLPAEQNLRWDAQIQ